MISLPITPVTVTTFLDGPQLNTLLEAVLRRFAEANMMTASYLNFLTKRNFHWYSAIGGVHEQCTTDMRAQVTSDARAMSAIWLKKKDFRLWIPDLDVEIPNIWDLLDFTVLKLLA